MKEEIVQSLKQVKDILLEREKNLKKFSTLGLTAEGDLISVYSEDALINVIKILAADNLSFRIIGKGSNVVLPEIGTRPYIKLNFPFNDNNFSNRKKSFIIPASVSLAKLLKSVQDYKFKGWECMAGIPGTLGGAISGNAGSDLGEIGNIVRKVFIISKDGLKKELEVCSNDFQYRKNLFLKNGEIIYAVELVNKGVENNFSEIIESHLVKRSKTQPINKRTCGSVFKNILGNNTCLAGISIDRLGLKGFRIGDIQISFKHANFIENLGEGTSHDVTKLVNFVQKELKLYYGVAFETEIRFL